MIIKISVVNKQARDLDLDDQGEHLVPFKFDQSQFVGYWIDHTDEEIIFYVGGYSFITPNKESTVKDFDIIIKQNTRRNLG